MEWLDELRAEFTGVRDWLTEEAFPALASGPLAKDASIQRLPAVFEDLKRELDAPRPVPVALAGETGVGKSTLLNALLDSDFLPTGVVGSQTAAFITIRYASEWKVECTYISEGELQAMFADAWYEENESQETGSLELLERARSRLKVLLQIGDGQPFPSRAEYLDGPPARLRDIVNIGRRVFVGEAEARQQLELHAKRQYWPITRFIDVEAPFEMLRSGVVISDLPGSGDINRERAQKAAAVIRTAGQILIACEARGLKEGLLSQLEIDGRLPHRLFREQEPVEIILVGTSLDNKLPDPETDQQQIRDLGLEPSTATDAQIFQAIVAGWERLVRGQFADWLNRLAPSYLEHATEREPQVSKIVSSLRTIATSAPDWQRFRRNKASKVCHTPELTGIPSLRDEISRLAEAQASTTRQVLQRKLQDARESAFSAIQRSEELLGADIDAVIIAVERSRQEMEAIQDRYVQQVESLRVTVLDRFQQLRERLSVSIDRAALTMERQGRDRVLDHLDGLHWASLRATIRHDGRWTTNAGRQVNLRDAIGGELTKLVPQAWTRIADEQLATVLDESNQKALGYLTDFSEGVRAIVDVECTDSASKKIVKNLFHTALMTARQETGTAAELVSRTRTEAAKEMQQRIDRAVEGSVGAICAECQNDSGVGWKARSVGRIAKGTEQAAEVAKKRTFEIADQAIDDIQAGVEHYCQVVVKQIEQLGSHLPDVLKDAVEKSRLAGPQGLQQRLQKAREAYPVVRA